MGKDRILGIQPSKPHQVKKTPIAKKTLIKSLPGLMIGGLFAVLIFQAMAWGPWAYNDSAAYISAARNISAGNGPVIQHTTGKVKLLTEFPPFYPIFLSIFGGRTGDYTSLIRTLNAIFFGLTILVVYLIFLILSHRSILSSIAVLIFASFEYIIEIFTGAMSETLFFLLLFLAWLMLLQYLKGNNKKISFAGLIILSALLPITRYAGILFVIVFWITISLLGPSTILKHKVKKAIIFLLVTFVPIGYWAISLLQKYNKFAGKNFSFNLSQLKLIAGSSMNVLQVASQWIPYVREYADTPISIMLQILVAGACAAIIGIPFIKFAKNREMNLTPNQAFHLSINIAIIGYFSLIVFMHSTSYPPIDIINRTILPLFPLLLLSTVLLIVQILDKMLNPIPIHIIFVVIGIIILRYNFLINQPYLNSLRTEGLGYTAKQYKESGIIEATKKYSYNRVTISNLSGFVLYHTNQYPILIETFPHYPFGAGNSYGESEFRQTGAALILFKSDFDNYYGEIADALYEKVTNSLNLVYGDKVGEIYTFSQSIQP